MNINKNHFSIIQNTIKWTCESCTSQSLSSMRPHFFNFDFVPKVPLANRTQDVVVNEIHLSSDVILYISKNLTLREKMQFLSINKYFNQFLKKPTKLLEITTFVQLEERIDFAINQNLKISYKADTSQWKFNNINELDNGANTKSRDPNGYRPLHRAIMDNNEKMFQLLLKCGADTEARDAEGRTPLYFTVQCGKLEMAKLLLEFKADVNARNPASYKTPIQLAFQCPNKEMAQLLQEYEIQ